MKHKINIFSSNNMDAFLYNLFFEYQVSLLKFDDLHRPEFNATNNVVIINNKQNLRNAKIDKLNNNYLILSNLEKASLNLHTNMNFLKTPLSVYQIKNAVKNFGNNLKINFHDISIINEKLTNIKNNSFCYLTKVEFEILSYLIENKEVNKSYIKENILKIKSGIETNSLESHLTRIRKKMLQINTSIKLQSKNEKLLITF
tara:strand:- start:82 stop:684 length:603 start_codon:yes stop_codon:yes gene_type:complete